MGPLYQQAVDFVLDNASLIPSDPRFRQLATVAAGEIATLAYADARSSIWKLFQADTDTQLRVRAVMALGGTAAGDPDIVQGLNRFLDSQNSIFSTGKVPDQQVVAAVIQALGKIGDPSSFPVLFTAMNRGYPDQVTTAARNSLLTLKGDFKEMVTGVLKAGLIAEKPAALSMAMETDRLTPEQKGQVAEYALDVALHSGAADNAGKDVLRGLRFDAARALAQRRWSPASALLIEHLDMTIMEFDRGLADKRYLLEAVAALGAIGTHEAAVRLTQYLVLLNSYTEKGRGFDEQIVLTVLDNLGSLGDKIAFDDLMYTQYLNYSAPVKKAARSALDKLKW
jgi:HEAT repeat protein